MNHLKNALSPYLLQHKDNPVNWHQWGESAFAEAKQRDVPILLSIGYSTCHWCHVMAHETFENPDIANYLNDHFVAIKVDREERPDIDHIYMDALTRMTGQGGWPLNIFLTPEQKPFFGGTYFPPEPRYGLASFPQVLHSIVQLWQNERSRVETASNEMTDILKRKISHDKTTSIDLESLLHPDTVMNLLDQEEGGLRGAPKFPQIPLWRWLFATAVLNDNKELIRACYLTAEKLCLGGIYDHIGGGFMRYSTDDKWLAPHFEKMLYDNAQIIYWLSELHTFSPNSLYLSRVTQTIDWLQREMLLPEGAFASALDADSEGKEGKYYIWDEHEIDQILGDEAKDYKTAYDISSQGNWEGMNIPHLNHPNRNKISDKMYLASKKLLATRQKRIPPSRDDKILLDWNALMIAGLAKAGLNFNCPQWIQLAETVFHNLEKLLFDQQWYHAYRAGQREHFALLEDYAYVIFALINLYNATGNKNYLNKAEEIIKKVEIEFVEENGLYNQISKAATKLIVNPQPLFDMAIPSGNGLMALNYAELELLNGNGEYQKQAQRILSAVFNTMKSNAVIHFSSFGLAYVFLVAGATIKADLKQVNEKMKAILFSHLPPNAVLIQDPNIKEIEICHQQSCLPPIVNEKSLLEALNTIKQY